MAMNRSMGSPVDSVKQLASGNTSEQSFDPAGGVLIVSTQSRESSRSCHPAIVRNNNMLQPLQLTATSSWWPYASTASHHDSSLQAQLVTCGLRFH
jgi:hypothetical protein